MDVTYLAHSKNWQKNESDLNDGDLLVVNAARSSVDRFHKIFNIDSDKRLLKFLARENHWAPFAHPTITLGVRAPIFVERQLQKHKMGFQKGDAESEMSFRYVGKTPEFYWPEEWRASSDDIKQGSLPQGVDRENIKNILNKHNFPTNIQYIKNENLHKVLNSYLKDQYYEIKRIYKKMLENVVCAEQARMILPLNTYTNFVWTGSLAAWARLVAQRTHPTAQRETQIIANKIDEIVAKLYPESWAALMGRVWDTEIKPL